MSEIVVHKFGGSCLREKSDIDRIYNIIKNTKESPVIVVSAIWGMTDRLIRAERDPAYAGRLVQDLRSQHLIFAPGLDKGEFSDLFERVMSGISNNLLEYTSGEASSHCKNLILAAGERLSALAVAHRLRELGLEKAQPIGAEDVGLKLKGKGRSKEINIELSSKHLDKKRLVGIPVLTGWFGEGEDGNIAVLSRGGSDHSAAAFANLLNAKKLILWKDVDGIKRLNPRWGLETPSIPYLNYEQALELSLHGTPIIHPATVIPLVEIGIPIEVRNFHKPTSNTPTTIGPEAASSGVIAIGCYPGVAVITNNKQLSSLLLSKIEEFDVSPWLMKSTPDSLKLIIPTHDFDRLEEFVEGKTEFKTAIVSIIGDCEIPSGYEIVSSNEYATRVIVETDNLSKTIDEIYHSLFSLQDCK